MVKIVHRRAATTTTKEEILPMIIKICPIKKRKWSQFLSSVSTMACVSLKTTSACEKSIGWACWHFFFVYLCKSMLAWGFWWYKDKNGKFKKHSISIHSFGLQWNNRKNESRTFFNRFYHGHAWLFWATKEFQALSWCSRRKNVTTCCRLLWKVCNIRRTIVDTSLYLDVMQCFENKDS